MNINPKIDDLILEPKYRNIVADEYGISLRTLNRWIKKAGLDIPNGLIDPYHLKIIYRAFDIPKHLKYALKKRTVSTSVNFWQLLAISGNFCQLFPGFFLQSYQHNCWTLISEPFWSVKDFQLILWKHNNVHGYKL